MTRRFHAPWCGHCKELKPPFQEIAWEFSLSEKVLIATMDCSKYGGLCKQNNVSAYPTLRYWIEGKVPEERDFSYPVAEGVYTDWHGAANTAKGLEKLKAFVLERLAGGEQPPDPGPVPEKAAPEKPKQEKRPKGWWKNPEKYKTDTAGVKAPKVGMSGLDITTSTTLGQGSAAKLASGELKANELRAQQEEGARFAKDNPSKGKQDL